MPSKRRLSPLLLLLFLAVSSTVTSHPLRDDELEGVTVEAPAILNTHQHVRDKPKEDATRCVRLDDVTEPLDEVQGVVVPPYLQGTEVPLDYKHRLDNTEELPEGWGLRGVKTVVGHARSWGDRLGKMWTEFGGGEGNVIGGKREGEGNDDASREEDL